jgi:AcrR family transcriptional regulator
MATNQDTLHTAVAAGSDEAAARDDAEKPMRADARRNRQRLVDAAREVFTEQGASASMEAIAKRAGVGVGTLYRHFPTRFDIVEAVYRDDVDELEDAARRAVAELDPWLAVEAFFEAFMSYARRKSAMMSELHQAFEKHPEFRSKMRERIDGSFALVIDRGKAAGVVRPDVEGSDVTELVGPICRNEAISPGQRQRLVGMILDGLRASAVRTGIGPASA